MMTDTREKLIELLWEYDQMRMMRMSIEECADHLLAHGVTFAEDNNVPSKRIPVTERLPEKSGEYLTLDDYSLRMVLEFSEVHQAFNASDYIPNDSEIHCTHWMPLPSPPGGTP